HPRGTVVVEEQRLAGLHARLLAALHVDDLTLDRVAVLVELERRRTAAALVLREPVVHVLGDRLGHRSLLLRRVLRRRGLLLERRLRSRGGVPLLLGLLEPRVREAHVDDLLTVRSCQE